MLRRKGNKPKFEDVEGNIAIAVFKNKNKKGTEYLKSTITIRTFPFKYAQSISISEPEMERLKILLMRKPKFVVKKKKGND